MAVVPGLVAFAGAAKDDGEKDGEDEDEEEEDGDEEEDCKGKLPPFGWCMTLWYTHDLYLFFLLTLHCLVPGIDSRTRPENRPVWALGSLLQRLLLLLQPPLRWLASDGLCLNSFPAAGPSVASTSPHALFFEDWVPPVDAAEEKLPTPPALPQ